MNYKNLIKNQENRLKILGLLKFIPDKPMIKLQYRIKTKRKLNLKNPTRFTEKVQWYKLNYKNPILPKCVDKYEVREYIKSKGLEDTLNELYGIYNNVEEIDFSKLPEQFVAKTTSGGGNLQVFICKDKKNFDIDEMKRIFKKQLSKKTVNAGREWPYDKIKPRIIIEKYLKQSEDKPSLVDYKFYCMHGKPQVLLVIGDRDNREKEKKSMYDMDFNQLNYKYADYQTFDKSLQKPEKFERMKEIAHILSEDFPFVRVDLYNINGKIYFGELTFFPASGYLEKIEPEGFDEMLGEKFICSRENFKWENAKN